jgi:signal transduction histidine kinase
MEIRKRLTYQFTAIVALILLFSSFSIYFSFSKSRYEEFYNRLESKAKLVAQMLLDIDEIDAELLRKIERNNPLSLPNEKIIIYDYKNNIIFTSDEEHVLNITVSMINDARLDEEVKFKSKAYEVLGEFYAGKYDRIVVFVGATDIFGLNKLKWLRIILLIVFFASLVIVYFAGRLFAARALRPISRMISRVHGISIENLHERLDEDTGKDELATLARTFNNMLQRLEASFKMQRNFIANASHELRTPLTVITGQLEVILLSARSNEEYINTMISVLDEIKNLNSLANRLLLLAQTSSERSDINFMPVRVDEVLWKAQKDILRRKNKSIIIINFTENIDDDAKLTIPGNELLLQTAFSNLIDNACKYSNDHRVDILIDYSETEGICIRFEDHGIGIPPEDLPMIFQPFYRSHNVLKINGHGIGLSLVERIIHMHEGSVQVNSVLDKGTVFTIQLFPEKTEESKF